MEFLHLDAVTHRELKSKRTGELYSHSAGLSELIGLKDIFVHHEIVPPRRRTSAPHIHSEQEEMVFVLSGQAVAHYGSQTVALQAGSFIGFKPGAEVGHFIENQTDEELRLLVISPKVATDKIAFVTAVSPDV